MVFGEGPNSRINFYRLRGVEVQETWRFFPPTIILTGGEGTRKKNTDSEEEERRARGKERERGLRQRDVESCAIGQSGRGQKLQVRSSSGIDFVLDFAPKLARRALYRYKYYAGTGTL